jgi:2,4-dienoyl-CoA reductase-like NADH-dependent reductase (Old Yellow Enzyme family)/NADPH-dependent 2,4-dienoyl-CoA reductase/sulfur reductase-like enzyme
MYGKLFEPFKIGNIEIKNRMVISPMVMNFCTEEGEVTERYIQYLEVRAKNGWGLITTEQMVVSKQGKGHPGQPVLWSDDKIPGLKKLTDRIHAAGAKINVQINHAGRQSSVMLTGEELVAPSALPNPGSPEVPRELTVDEIREIVEQFGDAALRAKKAGFDMIMEHGHHGYLIGSFLSPESNKRNDEYGGSLVNRFRFAKEVFLKMRERVGDDYPIGFRMSGIEYLARDEYLVFGKMLAEVGVDFIFLSEGQSVPSGNIAAGRKEKERYIADVGEMMKRVVNVPVGGSGYMLQPAMAEVALETGKLDFIGFGRSSLVDPELPAKLKDGRVEDIRQCLVCNDGCNGRVAFYKEATCVVNPLLGREEEHANRAKPAKSKKVFVAGGGISGMEAAIFAAEDGHDVTLFESGGKLGGQWLLAVIPPEKSHLSTLSGWQKRRLDQLGVVVRLSTPLTPTIVELEKPDSVIVATGAKPIVPNILGADGDNVVQAFDLLSGKVTFAPGSRIIVVGGGLVGCETAAHIAVHTGRVTILEMLDSYATDMNFMARPALVNLLDEQGVNVQTGAKVTKIGDGKITYIQNGEELQINNVDIVVLAIGAKAYNPLAEQLVGMVPQIIVAGDANKVRKAIDATRDGYEAAMQVH